MSQATKTAVITGAGQGIGKAIAKRMITSGFIVLLAETDAEAGRETENEFRSLGECRFIQTDVSQEDAVENVVREALMRYGRIDVLVNNAGISRFKPMQELSLEEWNHIIATNLTGAFLMAKYAEKSLRRHKGSVINIASTRALQSEPNTEAYSASKGGLVALTHALAASLSPEVRVNCISPGWIETSEWKKAKNRTEPKLRPEDHAQHWAGRVGLPEDIASMVLFLANPENGFITGANFVIDGGMTRKMIYEE